MDEGAAAFRRVRELFEAAVDVSAGERSAWLARACSDAGLRREVERLLACDIAGGEVADLLDRGPTAVLVDGAPPEPGACIGPFRLCGVLGSGGMGTVYEAEQDEPRRRVALKVLSLGLASEPAVRRFRWEAETLAQLRHPGIAQVYAVGVHRSGAIELPWFAMELVPGARDLMAHVTATMAPLRERIGLLLEVCDAVHHGHLQGVVHRDLKPQNLLVDGDGRVKVIDFGIARSTARAAGELELTAAGAVIGTPQYMSPEQLAGGSVDQHSDVYALGVIAFELAAGQRPFATRDTSPLALAASVAADEAPRLGSIAPGVDRDLELVVGKALRRDPAARYPSVAAFADDLRAWLDARPVRARPPSTLYQLRMFARRRRGLVIALAVIAALLVVGAALLLRQSAETERRARIAQRVAAFARDFLAESDAMKTRGVDYTVREALDVAAARLADERFDDAEIEAELRQLVGDTYASLSLPAVALPQLERAFALWGEVRGSGAARTIACGLSLALARCDGGQVDAAVDLLDGLEARADRTVSRDDPLWWRIQHQRAFLWRSQGRLRDAARLYRDVIAARERLLGTDAAATVASMQNLGTLLLALGEPAAARDVLAAALQRARRGGQGDASAWQIADNLAEAWRDLGDLDAAEACHREAMAGYERLLGPDHQLTIGCGYHLLKVLYRKGECPAVVALATELLARCERTLGPEDYRTMFLVQALGMGLLGAGDVTGAIANLQRVWQTLRRVDGPAHSDAQSAGQQLVSAQLRAGDAAAALQTSGELVEALDADAERSAQLPAGVAVKAWLLHARAQLAAAQRDAALASARRARQLLAAEPTPDAALAREVDELVARLAPP